MAITSIFPSGNSGKKINDAVITLVSNNFVYDGIKKTQQVSSVVLNGTTLTQNVDYVVVGNRATNAGTYMLSVLGAGRYSGTASSSWSIAKAQGSIEVDTNSMSLQGEGTEETAEFSVVGDGTVTASSSDSSVAVARIEENRVYVECVGSGEANITVVLGEGNNYLGASCQIAVICSVVVHIYGVSWDKSSSTVLTRTDDATLFTDPNPAVNNGTGSSPFDNILPWSGMVKETIDGNAMVKIPKFWYKWTDDSSTLKLQIANKPQTGFHTSPAHADRGDGKGERAYVYVGRYHCGSDYTSKTGVSPVTNITRATARTGCTNLGTGYYQYDYAMLWTIRMLYLVEYANWDSQKVIGWGCGNNSSKQNVGASDTMTYHTGTMQANRSTYGVGCQYRYIEGLWDNVCDFCDGIVLSSRNPYVTLSLTNYGDSTTSHTQVGTGPSSNSDISGWNVPTTSGLEWALFPSATKGTNYTTYCADSCNASYDVVYVGGYYSQSRGYGMFYSNSHGVSYSSDRVGARLQYLP